MDGDKKNLATLGKIDEAAVLWLNAWVGQFPLLDNIAKVVVSDYLVPVLMALVLLGLWFTGENALAVERNQRGVITATLSIIKANLIVEFINIFVFRTRPFGTLDLVEFFYRPTDSSFPANPAAFGFAAAFGIWTSNQRAGTALFIIASIFSFVRIYAGVFYPSDVIGGAAIGIMAGILARMLLKHIEPIPTKFLNLARRLYLA